MQTTLRLIIGAAAASALIGIGSANAQTPEAAGSGSGSAGASASANVGASVNTPVANANTNVSADAGGALGVSSGTTTEATPPAPDDPDAKGKFNAGGGLSFPSGPDAMGKYASMNWVALGVKGRYNATAFARVYMDLPLAVKHPDAPMGAPSAVSPSMFGGIKARGELGAKAIGLQVTLGYMKERSFFYSDKMFPYYAGDYTPAVSAGAYIHVKKWGLYFDTAPTLAYQSAGQFKKADGSGDGGAAIQLPLSAAVHLGELLEVAADTGLYTGAGLSFDAKDQASIFAGGSITIKVKPVKVHLGAGVASLLTGDTTMGAAYGSIGDSVYFDLNAAYVK